MNAGFFLDRQYWNGRRGGFPGKIGKGVYQGYRTSTEQSQPVQSSKTHPHPGSEETAIASMQTESDRRSRRQKAWEMAQQGNYPQAIEILSQMILSDPAGASDYNNRGLIYFQSGQKELALADYKKALNLNPQLASAYNNLANYYADRGKLALAIVNYDKAIDFNPVHVRAWINRGITLRDMGLYDRAIDNFDRALELGSLTGHIWAERGRAYHLKREWKRAIADYRRALEKLPFSSSNPVQTGDRLRSQVESWLDDLLDGNP